MTVVDEQAAMLKEQSITVKELLATVEQQSVTNEQQMNLIQNLRDENRVNFNFNSFKHFLKVIIII